MTSGLILSALAILLTAGGVAVIHGVWRRRLPRRGMLALGWLLLVLSAALWIYADGAEFGLVRALVVISLVAWGAVWINRRVRLPRREEREQVLAAPKPGRGLVRNTVLFVLSVPVAGAASALVSVLLGHWLSVEPANRAAVAIVLLPLLWGCALYWACADSKLSRPALGLVAGGVLSALFLYL